MIEESYVGFDTARMLKEAGFRELTKTHYSNSGQVWETAMPADYNDDFSCNTCNRPTQALAARWLRDVHDIHVVITEEPYVNGINYLWQVFIYNPASADCWDDESTGMYGDNGEYKTYEEALEAGLREAIKLIKK